MADSEQGDGARAFYDSNYGRFRAPVLEEVRRETYGQDIGQMGWLTVEEQRQHFKWLKLGQASNVLEVACGSGGPALFMADETGCQVIGLDINEEGIARANEAARARGMETRAQFRYADASEPLPFEAELFDAVICIDSINHLPNRLRMLKEWSRVLKPGGRLLFTDPIIVSGLLSHEEIATRSSIGYFLYAPPGEDERLIGEAGLDLLIKEDATANMAVVSKRWSEARSRREAELVALEGRSTFEGTQEFLSVVNRLASERRLSRAVFVAQKP
jgi:SAM-dependent methyltransferase